MQSTEQHRYILNRPHIASQVIEGETILIHFERGRYYSLSGLSSELLQHLVQQGRSVEQVTEALATQFQIERRTAVEGVGYWLAALSYEALIVPDNRHPAPGESGTEVRFEATAYVTPRLEVYTDLEHLLAFDPIHDVDESGWPTRIADST